MTKRNIMVVLACLCSLASLSVDFTSTGTRGLACLESAVPLSSIALSGDLLQQVQDESLKKSAYDYYNFLSRVEAQALSSRQSVRAGYGLFDQAVASPIRLVNFDPAANQFAQGFLWGDIGAITYQMPAQTPVSMDPASVDSALSLYQAPTVMAGGGLVKGLGFAPMQSPNGISIGVH